MYLPSILNTEGKSVPETQANPFGDVPQIDAKTAYERLAQGDTDILDVREAEEWQLGHIKGAKWLPLGQLPSRWREIAPDRNVVVVCLTGARSTYAASLLRQVGIQAANLEGGMLAWQAEQLPITAPGIIVSH